MKNETNSDPQYYASLFQQGDEKGLNYVFDRLYRLVVFYAHQIVPNKAVAEELATSAFTKIWRHHYKLDNIAAIKAYLLKTVARDCHSYLKNERKKSTQPATLLSDLPDDTDTFGALVRAETYNLLYEAIEKLSPGMQAVIKLMYIEGNTLTQTAQLLHLNTSTVDTQKKRAIKALSELMPGLGLLLLSLGCPYYLLF